MAVDPMDILVARQYLQSRNPTVWEVIARVSLFLVVGYAIFVIVCIVWAMNARPSAETFKKPSTKPPST